VVWELLIITCGETTSERAHQDHGERRKIVSVDATAQVPHPPCARYVPP
jgi:hypothetical protein